MLSKAAASGGLKVAGILHDDLIKNISLLSEQEWDEVIAALSEVDDRLGHSLQQVRPEFDASIRKPELKTFHQAPSRQEMGTILKNGGLEGVRVLPESVDNAVHTLHRDYPDASVPQLKEAYPEAVKVHIEREMRMHFKAFSLARSRPITTKSIQSVLGGLRQTNPDYYERCIDDSKRPDLLKEAEALRAREKSMQTELSDEAQSQGLDVRKPLKTLMNESHTIKAEEGDLSNTVRDVYVDGAWLTDVVRSYDALARYLNTSEEPLSYRQICDLAIQDAMKEGIVLNVEDWRSGIGRVPLETSRPTDESG